MTLQYRKSFQRQFSKLPETKKQLVRDALELFEEDPMHNSLRNHPLKDERASYRSITAHDDLRLHYRIVNKDIALFVAVGNHDQLYK
jgi:addiction module RelE/StbE family toxin